MLQFQDIFLTLDFELQVRRTDWDLHFLGIQTSMATGQVTVDAGVFQAALLQVAEATKSAAAAAQAAGASQATSSSSSAQAGKGTIDWSKLLNKPANFGEGKSVEDDVRQAIQGLALAATAVFGGHRRGISS